MSEVKRYGVWPRHLNEPCAVPAWGEIEVVAASDYDQLSAQAKAIRDALVNLCDFILDECDVDEPVGQRCKTAAVNADKIRAAYDASHAGKVNEDESQRQKDR